jgi:hypothetical protein
VGYTKGVGLSVVGKGRGNGREGKRRNGLRVGKGKELRVGNIFIFTNGSKHKTYNNGECHFILIYFGEFLTIEFQVSSI